MYSFMDLCGENMVSSLNNISIVTECFNFGKQTRINSNQSSKQSYFPDAQACTDCSYTVYALCTLDGSTL